jgi:hypothetical protein
MWQVKKSTNLSFYLYKKGKSQVFENNKITEFQQSTEICTHGKNQEYHPWMQTLGSEKQWL